MLQSIQANVKVQHPKAFIVKTLLIDTFYYAMISLDRYSTFKTLVITEKALKGQS